MLWQCPMFTQTQCFIFNPNVNCNVRLKSNNGHLYHSTMVFRNHEWYWLKIQFKCNNIGIWVLWFLYRLSKIRLYCKFCFFSFGGICYKCSVTSAPVSEYHVTGHWSLGVMMMSGLTQVCQWIRMHVKEKQWQ